MLALFPVLAPSLPLLAFLSASASTVQASSSPPDPFANPKYALTFLNDLPIERSLADRYLAEGIASPAAFYHLGDTSTGRAVSAGDELAPNARRGIEGHARRSGDDDNDHDASAVIPMAEDAAAAVSVGEPSGTSPPSSNQPTHNYTLEHLLLPPSRSYLCLLPPPPPKNTFGQHPASSPPVPPMDPELPAKLLQHLDDQCLYMKQGWFTYAYCHGKEIRQFREANRPWPPPLGGYVPQEDPTKRTYILGTKKVDLNVAQDLPSVSLGRGTGSRYLVQRWGGGTICDKTDKAREIEIQFHCSMSTTDSIALIKEVSTCNYVLVIHTPRLCNVPGFSSMTNASPPTGIACREVVPDGSVPQELIDQGPSKTSGDRTPLPSWAHLPPGGIPPKPKAPLLNPLMDILVANKRKEAAAAAKKEAAAAAVNVRGDGGDVDDPLQALLTKFIKKYKLDMASQHQQDGAKAAADVKKDGDSVAQRPPPPPPADAGTNKDEPSAEGEGLDRALAGLDLTDFDAEESWFGSFLDEELYDDDGELYFVDDGAGGRSGWIDQGEIDDETYEALKRGQGEDDIVFVRVDVDPLTGEMRAVLDENQEPAAEGEEVQFVDLRETKKSVKARKIEAMEGTLREFLKSAEKTKKEGAGGKEEGEGTVKDEKRQRTKRQREEL